MLLERLAVEYGHSVNADVAMRAAARYAEACARMGGRWVLLEPMSGTVQFPRGP